MSTLFSVGPEDVALTTDDWYTPRWIFDAAGLTFDMDVCAPSDPTRRTCPARRYLTFADDGLAEPWEGLVWCNPPFSSPAAWVRKWCKHRNGLLLVAASRASWWDELLSTAEAMTLLRVAFLSPDGKDWGTYRIMIGLLGLGEQAAEAIGRVGPAFRSCNLNV